MQKILVCDDDHEIVEAISIYLSGEGFEVLKAYDGLEDFRAPIEYGNAHPIVPYPPLI